MEEPWPNAFSLLKIDIKPLRLLIGKNRPFSSKNLRTCAKTLKECLQALPFIIVQAIVQAPGEIFVEVKSRERVRLHHFRDMIQSLLVGLIKIFDECHVQRFTADPGGEY